MGDVLNHKESQSCWKSKGIWDLPSICAFEDSHCEFEWLSVNMIWNMGSFFYQISHPAISSSRTWVSLCLQNIHPKKVTLFKRGCDHGVFLGCPGKQWSTNGVSGVFSKQGVSWYIFALLHLEMCKLDKMQRCPGMAEREKDWSKLCFNYSRRKAAPFGPLQLRKNVNYINLSCSSHIC